MKKAKEKKPTLVNINDTANHDRYDDVYTEYTCSKIAKANQKKSGIEFTTENNIRLRVSAVGEHIIRFRYAVHEFEKDHSFAVSKNFKPKKTSLQLNEDKNSYIISTEQATCIVSKSNMKVSVFNPEGKLISKDKGGFIARSTINEGFNYIGLQKSIIKSEVFFGLGDKTSKLNLRGQRLENWNTDSFAYGKHSDPLYKTIPFFYGLRNGLAYGIFFDNTSKSIFDFDSKKKNELSFHGESGEMNYYLILGPSLDEVAQRYTLLTGTPELPPMWALGYHQCRWSYYPEGRVLALAKKFRNLKIPCDSIYLDIDYMDGFRCFTWSKKFFPNLKKVLNKIEDKGFDTVVMIDPGIKVDPDYFVYNQGIKKGYFCKRTDGKLMIGPVWPENCVFPDFTKKEVRDWWGALYKELYLDIGVSGFWNDMNEPAVFKVNSKTFPDEVMHHMEGQPSNHRRAHNIYGQQMAKATFKGLKKLNKEKRPFVLTRATYSGGQRYASVWTGDNIATWEHMQIANSQTQRLSISGFSFSGSDIGGFVDQPTADMMSRWLQLGVFHPFYRVHSIGNREDGSAGIEEQDVEMDPEKRLDQEPWAFGEEATALNRKAIEFRYKMLPYIYSCFNDYVVEGKPMIRSLIFADQKDKNLLNVERDFLFGEHLLVSPVIKAKTRSQTIYLPKGSWFDFHTGETFAGGKKHKVKVKKDRIPVFAKAGSVIPMHTVRQHTKEPADQLILRIFLSNDDFTCWYYEDAGEGYEYLEDQYKEIAFDFNVKSKSIEAATTTYGEFKMHYKNILYQIYGLPELTQSILINGKSVPYTRSEGVVRFSSKKIFKTLEIS